MAKLWYTIAATLLALNSAHYLHAQAPRTVTSLDSLDLPFGTTVQQLFLTSIRSITREVKPVSCRCSLSVSIDTAGRLTAFTTATDCEGISTEKHFKIIDQAVSLAPRQKGEKVQISLDMSAAFDSTGRPKISIPMRSELSSFVPPRLQNIDSVKRKIYFSPTLREYIIASKKFYSKKEKIYQLNFTVWMLVSDSGFVEEVYVGRDVDPEIVRRFDFNFMSFMRFEPSSFSGNRLPCWFPWPINYRTGETTMIRN